MSETTKVPPKTYISTQLSFTANYYDDENKRKKVHFVNGIFTTDDKDLQDHVEALDGFGKFIKVGANAPTPLELKAAALRADADAADEAAEAAEKAVADFMGRPKALRAAADAADKAAKAVEDAVAKEKAGPAPVATPVAPPAAPVPAPEPTPAA